MISSFWDPKIDKTRIKICNINSLETACILDEIGVDAIGIHFWEKNYSATSIEKIKWVQALTSKAISKWVLLDTYNFEIISNIISAIPFDTIQFQGYVEADSFKILTAKIKANFPLIKIVKSVSSNLSSAEEAKKYIDILNTCCDGILFDTGWRGGTGVTNNISGTSQYSKFCKVEFIVAGGITIDNVSKIVADLKPLAVDIQSGVENIYLIDEKKIRVKSIKKIKRIIDTLKEKE